MKDLKLSYVKNIKNVEEKQNLKQENNVLTKKEYEALIWLKNNTQKDITFVTDRQALNYGKYDEEFLNNRFFYYSAYSNRRCFLEGYSYSSISNEMLQSKLEVVKNMYSKGYSNKYTLAKNNNIDYIIVSKFINPDFSISENGISICFENEDIAIYKVE